ncbi:hypothetical protein Taro_045552 [Colocasia esculenta]|uniref:Uncharacterized protein n=1 Tax=Colocasia esculenta TaxID=4460 RepID=A0A843WPS4_COLES|nr:hypothetical protein [Colocasia esculenta]
MASETEPAKTLLPYLQRADELQKHEPLVAYYCRLYAMEKGLKIPVKERTKTTNSILVSLMNQLEKDKKSLKLGPEDSLYVEGFASNVFAKADKQDRAGRADLNTAKTFYAASIFFEIVYQFGELQPDIEQKQKYAAWKAADIRKALKEGRKPEPGPPGEDKDLSIPSITSTNAFDMGHTEPFPGQQPAVDVSHHVDKSDLQHPENLPTSPSSYPGPGFHPSDAHQPPVSHRTESSTYPQHSQDSSYSSEQQPTHQNYPSDGHPAPTHQHYPSEGHSPPSYPSQDKPVRSYSPSGHPPNYPSYDTGAPHSYPSHASSMENYPSHEASSGYTYSNFQTYPSFNDSSLPAAPSQHPSYYHGSDANQAYQSAPASGYPSAVQYDSSGRRNGTHTAAPSPPAAATYTYDSSYQPSVEKIAEAHKAARFAVGALAFDDVPVAVDFLRRSLELLTNPSAETH